MARRIGPITKENFGDIPFPCRQCFFWENPEPTSGPLSKPENSNSKAAWFEQTLTEWGECGKLLYDDREALAYIQYAPLSSLPQCSHFPSGPVSRDASVISCLYVVPEMRGRGLGKVLLRSTLKDLLKKNLRTVEAFAARQQELGCAVPLGFYLRNGFYVLRDHQEFPLVRLDLRAAVTWQANIQAMLDNLKIPVRVPAISS